MGRVPWDRFQTLAGIQYFFDTEFQLLRGHMYYSGTEWGLSSINQSGMWERQRILARDGHVSVLSVDIGDFNTRRVTWSTNPGEARPLVTAQLTKLPKKCGGKSPTPSPATLAMSRRRCCPGPLGMPWTATCG